MNNDLLLPVLMTVTVSLLAWGLFQLFGGLSDQRKKLQQRLSGEGAAPAGFDPETFTVVKRKIELKGASGALAKIPGLRTLAHNITQVWPNFSLAKFVFLSAACGVVFFMIAAVVTMKVLLGGVAALIGGFIPLIVLNSKRAKRERAMLDALPEALDFLSRVLRSGHSLSTGLQMMAEELPEPLASEFRKCYDSHSVGLALEDALKETAIRVDNSDFGFFVTATLIQRQTGGDLSEVLNNISGMIRQRIRLSQHVKAKTAEGRFTGYVLVVFPVIMFLISYYLNPKYGDVLLHTSKGIGLMLLAGVMLMMGLYAIRRITTIRV
jgi:tight adherence protein B